MATEPIITWYPYQRAWLEDKARFKIGMFARQTGKTYSTCGEIVSDCVRAEMAGERVRWVILSRGERQAREAINECVKPLTKAFYVLYRSASRRLRDPEFTESEFKIAEATYKSLEVYFPNGSRITALPANPDTARGFSANVFLDEFAFHQDSRQIWKALFPVVSKPGLKLRVTSTPNGKSNKFFDLWTAQDQTWSRHFVDVYRAVKDGLERNIDELRLGAGDEDLWRQEYELEFMDEASAWLTYDLITACEHEDAGKPELYRGGPCFIGNDIARRNDLWVAWVWELLGDVLWCREIATLKNVTFTEQALVLDRLMKKYRVVRLAMDQTGMGEKPVEDAINRYGRHAVEGIIMSGARRLDVATSGKQRFEDRLCRIPVGDPILRADLHKIKKTIGPTGAPRLVADRDSDGHADRAWAAFMGAAAADVGPQLYEYASVKSLAQADRWGLDDDDYLPSGFGGRPGFGAGAW